MSNFRFKPEEFGEQADRVRQLVEQALSFSKNETEKEKQKAITELENQLATIKTNQELEKELLLVEDKNKDLIKDLIGNDLSKLSEIKTKYSHLFEISENKTPIEDILKGGVNTNDIKENLTLTQLKEKYINGKTTEEEEEEYYKLLEKEIT